MFKNDAKTRGHSIPRYTEEDRERLVTMCKDDLVKPGVTFGDLYKGQIKSAVVPLEEGVLKTCFYKRMVLVGDSWHKVRETRSFFCVLTLTHRYPSDQSVERLGW